jgi:hypothetical protein
MNSEPEQAKRLNPWKINDDDDDDESYTSNFLWSSLNMVGFR